MAPFDWLRGYHVGGRSLMWARQSYRFGPLDFEANAKEGVAIPWPVTYDEIAKGYELPTGETVVLTDEDFADLPLRTSRAIDVLQFVPLEEVDPIYFAKSYFLEPDKSGVKPYVLLRDALEQSATMSQAHRCARDRKLFRGDSCCGGDLWARVVLSPRA